MFRRSNLLTIIAILLLGISSINAQETTGGIEGTVTDPNGAVVPNAEVTITGASSTQAASVGFSRKVQTDSNGFFRVLQVPPGKYNVSVAELNGFSPATLENVNVALGKITALNLGLTIGDQNVTVPVSANDTLTIDPAEKKIQTNISAQTADLLPKGTSFTSLLGVAPAVRAEPLGGGFQVDGASGSENTFVVDGQEVTNFRTGTLNQNNNLPFQLVQEIQVKSSGFEAEFGGATGGVINVVTKGGNNEFHGDFGASFQTANMQAAPRQFLRLYRTGSVAGGNFFQSAEYIKPARLGGTNFFPSANLSGPIIKNRLWFFASYTPQIFNTSQTQNYITSDPRNRTVRLSETYESTQKNEYAFLRLDSSVSDSLRLSGSFTYNPTVLDGVLPLYSDVLGSPFRADFGGSTGVLVGPALLGQQGGRRNSNNVLGSAVWTPNENLIINLRAGRSFLNEKIDQANGYYSYGVPRITRFICSGVAQAGAGCIPGDQNINSNYAIDYDVSIRKTFDADATYLANNFAGKHQFKFGYQHNGISNDTKQGYTDFGVVTLLYGTSIDEYSGNSDLVPTPGNLGSGRLRRFGTVGKASSTNNAFYVQDRWQPVTRLSLNLGLRFEKENVPSFREGFPGIEFGLGDKVAPRLGFAYDLTGDGKTKIFGSYGWFYDRFKYELPRGSFGGDFFRDDFFEILPSRGAEYSIYTLQRILGNNPDNPGGNCPSGGITGTTGWSRCQTDGRIPSNDPSVPVEVGGGIDPDLKPFRQSEFTVGFERELGFWNLLASGRYTHKQVDRAVEDIGFLNNEGSEVYVIGNPGFGLSKTMSQEFGYPVTPKAERVYDALEVRLDKRLSNNIYFNANYTFSRLYGNYPGLASSDEASIGNTFTAGRNAPNVNRLYDLPFVAFTADGKPNNGRLPTDRPHAFKFYGAYSFDWKEALGFGANNSTEFSAFSTVQSGSPVTTRFTFEGVTSAILHGRGDLGRTETFTQTDLALRHKYRFGRDNRFGIEFNLDVLNAFNEANVVTRSQIINARVDFAALFEGTGPEVIRQYFAAGSKQRILDYINSRPDLKDASYNQPSGFQTPRSVRFGFRFIF